MTLDMGKRADIRTTISLATIVWKMAKTMMAQKGFNENFSAYVADLVRRDLEAHGNPAPKSAYPPIKRRNKFALNE